jgi:hypothetical protein
MTIGITGPQPKVPGGNVLAGWIIAAIIVGIGLWLLRVASDVLVDWLWFSSVGYSGRRSGRLWCRIRRHCAGALA